MNGPKDDNYRKITVKRLTFEYKSLQIKQTNQNTKQSMFSSKKTI